MQKVLLVRHGQASAGTHDYDRLSEKGIAQATVLGNFWAQQQFKIDKAYAGTLKRQQDTAKYALQASSNASIEQNLVGLNEYNHQIIDQLFGEGCVSDGGDGLSFDDYRAIMQRWRDASDATLNGAQSWEAFSQAGWLCVQQVLENAPQAKTIALFTSGGVIATIIQQALALDFDRTMDSIWQIRNASITTLGVNDGRILLVDYNTVSHLDAQLDSNLITLI